MFSSLYHQECDASLELAPAICKPCRKASSSGKTPEIADFKLKSLAGTTISAERQTTHSQDAADFEDQDPALLFEEIMKRHM